MRLAGWRDEGFNCLRCQLIPMERAPCGHGPLYWTAQTQSLANASFPLFTEAPPWTTRLASPAPNSVMSTSRQLFLDPPGYRTVCNAVHWFALLFTYVTDNVPALAEFCPRSAFTVIACVREVVKERTQCQPPPCPAYN